MTRCPNCRRQVDEGERVCSFCDEPLNAEQSLQGTSQSQRGQQQPTERRAHQTGEQAGPGQPASRKEPNTESEGTAPNQRARQSTANASGNTPGGHGERHRHSGGAQSQSSGQTIQNRNRSSPGQLNVSHPSDEDSLLTTFGPSAIAGAGAFIVGFAITYLIKWEEAVSELPTTVFGSQLEAYQGVGWVFFVMHNVQITVSGSGPGGSVSQSFGPGELNNTYLFIVPIVLLALAGYLIAKRVDATTFKSGFIMGATTTIGYVVLVAVSVFIISFEANEGSRSASIGPEIAQAIVIAGIIYPVICGGIGGAVWGASSS